MWIAKPLKALSQDEAFFYQKIVELHSAPLSQSSLWGEAIMSTGTQVYVAFDSEKKIGGLAFFYQDSMECINGPMLNWGTDGINEELATFVYALTQANKQTKRVIIKPRFQKSEETIKTNYLKFPIHSYEETATKILQLNPKEDLDLFLGPKIRSELQRTHKHLDEILLEEAELDDFYERLQRQYKKKKEFLPEKSWFEKLLPQSKIFSAQFEDMIHSQIFMTLHHKTVYYLFANEERDEGAPNISLNLLLQRQAIEWALEHKAQFYDLSGYKRGIDKTDSYWGVKVFKDKFPGEIVDFFSPVFIFE